MSRAASGRIVKSGGFVVIVLLPVTLMVSAAGADTEVGGLICTDTTWDMAGSPYVVTANAGGSIMIGCDATLTVAPGVEVRFAHGLGVTVGHSAIGSGALVARGTSASPILLTSNAPYQDPNNAAEPGDWVAIYLTDYAVDATYAGDLYESGSILEHVILEY